jgi:hypothetical protein
MQQHIYPGRAHNYRTPYPGYLMQARNYRMPYPACLMQAHNYRTPYPNCLMQASDSLTYHQMLPGVDPECPCSKGA